MTGQALALREFLFGSTSEPTDGLFDGHEFVNWVERLTFMDEKGIGG